MVSVTNITDPIPEVAIISGHKDVKMLFSYTHLKVDSVVSKLA